MKLKGSEWLLTIGGILIGSLITGSLAFFSIIEQRKGAFELRKAELKWQTQGSLFNESLEFLSKHTVTGIELNMWDDEKYKDFWLSKVKSLSLRSAVVFSDPSINMNLDEVWYRGDWIIDSWLDDRYPAFVMRDSTGVARMRQYSLRTGDSLLTNAVSKMSIELGILKD